MSDGLFFALLVLNGWHLIRLVLKPTRFFELPTLMSLSVTGFVIPQLLYLRNFAVTPESSTTTFLLLVLSSQLFATVGWNVGRNSRAQPLFRAVDPRKMLYVIFCIGIVFTVWLRSLPPSVLMQSQWTGLPVVLNFF